MIKINILWGFDSNDVDEITNDKKKNTKLS